MPKLERFDPPEVVSRSVVTGVNIFSTDWCTVTYIRHDGVIGCNRVDPMTWPGSYWPPAVGDVVKVEIKPVITFETRPRKVQV